MTLEQLLIEATDGELTCLVKWTSTCNAPLQTWLNRAARAAMGGVPLPPLDMSLWPSEEVEAALTHINGVAVQMRHDGHLHARDIFSAMADALILEIERRAKHDATSTALP